MRRAAILAAVWGIGGFCVVTAPVQADEPCRWTDEWYCRAAERPVGARQECRHGKLWPPFPRPVGEEQEFTHIYHSAHYWPWPYACYDRATITAISSQQIMNGWIAEATLYDYHFDPATHLLSPAGVLHLQWILENVPVEQRCVWVQTSVDSIASQQRLINVRSQTVALVGEENCPPVMLRVGAAGTRPAKEIISIQKADLESMPRPRIQYQAPVATGGK